MPFGFHLTVDTLPSGVLPKKVAPDRWLQIRLGRIQLLARVDQWALSPMIRQVGWTMGLEPTTTGITIRDSTN
jgi:hypothetical protein